MSDVVDSDRRLFTREEFYRMFDAGLFAQERVELLRGEILTMSPINPPHASAGDCIVEALRGVFRDGYVIREQKPLTLARGSEPEPDVAVVRGRPRDFSHAHPTRADLVVEIAESCLAKDRRIKAPIYAEAGIAGYWILNLQRRVLEVHRQPERIGTDFGFAQTTLYREQDLVSPLALPDAQIRVADLLPSATES